MLNSVNIIGNVGADPEIRYFDSGRRLARFSVAINSYSKKDDAGPIWVTCELWNEAVDRLEKCNVVAGRQIAVTGMLAVNAYTRKVESVSFPDKKLYIKVLSFQVLGAPKSEEAPAEDAAEEAEELSRVERARQRA